MPHQQHSQSHCLYAGIQESYCIEKLVIIILSKHNLPLEFSQIASGNKSSCTFSIAEIARTCLLCNAGNVIAIKNHVNTRIPSPSKTETASVTNLYHALDLLNIHLLDFIIICPNKQPYSFQQSTLGPYQTASPQPKSEESLTNTDWQDSQKGYTS